MQKTAMIRFSVMGATLLGVAMLSLVGCSKKSQEAPAPAASAAPVATAPAPAEAPPADAGQGSAPTVETAQAVADPSAAMAAMDAQIKQREYEKAVRTMMAVQQAQLNAQQAALARQQMVNLQRTLANAVASGDPNAAAAGELLRAAHRH